ncbi:hypothetical protein [Profundibacter sp.]
MESRKRKGCFWKEAGQLTFEVMPGKMNWSMKHANPWDKMLIKADHKTMAHSADSSTNRNFSLINQTIT